MDNRIPAVKLSNISKHFGPVAANSHVNMDIYRGEILALLGENGSGKTTLMNMLSGVYFPDEGEIFIDGKPVTIASPRDAFGLGIGMVHQHFKLIDVLTAAENIVLGLEGKLDIKEASKKIKEICDKYGFEVNPSQKIYDMSVSQKQTVEIVKVLFRGAEILILDEPTAVLTPQETEKLFAVLRKMKEDNKAIGAISWKMNGHTDLTDRDDECELGFWVGKPFWGRGIMPEAVKAILRHAFADIGMTKVWIGYYEGNVKSKRVQEKCGFRFQWKSEGVDVPLLHEKRTGYVSSMTREEWLEREGA